jgi:hypothetical protein
MDVEHQKKRHVLGTIECDIETGQNLQRIQLQTSLEFKQRMQRWFQFGYAWRAENCGSRDVLASSALRILYGLRLEHDPEKHALGL